jgi:hypothetical protein
MNTLEVALFTPVEPAELTAIEGGEKLNPVTVVLFDPEPGKTIYAPPPPRIVINVH